MSVNQKLENLLNLSLDTTAKERSRSAELETGYNPEEQTWELIVKYSGSLDAARELGAAVEEMRNEYAILTVKESLIPYISALPQIEYIEKPKRLFFAWSTAKNSLLCESAAGGIAIFERKRSACGRCRFRD